MSNDNNQRNTDRPTIESLPTLESFAAPLSDDPFSGAPRRMECRAVVPGRKTCDYRVTVMQPATMQELLEGVAERVDPNNEESTPVIWKPITQWIRISGPEAMTAIEAMVDPDNMIN